MHLHLSEVGSTNTEARRLLRDSQPADRTLVTAAAQTAGRGQRDRLWSSRPGLDITASYILRPTFLAAERQFMLAAAVAVALHGAVSEFCSPDDVVVKWPNDILVGRKKVAGILIENSLRGKDLDTSIVGIGLNVNSTDLPITLRATSLSMLVGTELPLQEVLHSIDGHVGRQYERLRALRFADLMADYNRLLFGRGSSVQLIVNGTLARVKVLGAQDSGLLNLLHADGRVTEHAHHELGWEPALSDH